MFHRPVASNELLYVQKGTHVHPTLFCSSFSCCVRDASRSQVKSTWAGSSLPKQKAQMRPAQKANVLAQRKYRAKDGTESPLKPICMQFHANPRRTRKFYPFEVLIIVSQCVLLKIACFSGHFIICSCRQLRTKLSHATETVKGQFEHCPSPKSFMKLRR